MFWLRGVADLFGARAAYLTGDEAPPAASRQLALRLGVSALDRDDRMRLADQLGGALMPHAGTFLERAAYERWQRLTVEAPKAIKRLQRYRRASYWIAPRHRNLAFLPTQLRDAAPSFDPEQRWSLALLFDLSWLYLVALLAAIDDMSRLHVADSNFALGQVVVGSEHELRERTNLANQLRVIFEALPVRRRGASPATTASRR